MATADPAHPPSPPPSLPTAAAEATCPANHATATLPMSGCPAGAAHDERRHSSQDPAPGQLYPLPKGRQVSSIPMTHSKDADGKWVYPSEQMFYNSMMRKGFAPNEKEMGTVVLIHNAVNEQAWREVVRWEQTFHSDCPKVKLSSFVGKPRELSPKARMQGALYGSSPFDRHDWMVDRCGTSVRYIIDFYTGHVPEKDSDKVVPIHIDARPAALDSFTNFVDVLRKTVFGLNDSL